MQIAGESMFKEFAEAVSNLDIDSVASLLADYGQFSITNSEGESISGVDKEDYLVWLDAKMKEFANENPNTVKIPFTHRKDENNGYDSIMFDAGKFPVKSLKDDSGKEVQEVGISIYGINNQVCKLSFWYMWSGAPF